MNQIIAKDLGITVEEIRKTEWNDLEKMPRNFNKIPFRPNNIFPINGNINLALNREMGMKKINFNEFKRGVCYKIKCLLRKMKNA